jgi:hypothetical protein
LRQFPTLPRAPKKEHSITAQLRRCAGAIVNLLKRKLSHLQWVLQSLVSYMEILPEYREQRTGGERGGCD